MGRPLGHRNRKPPKYRLHKPSGRAYVEIEGKAIYLGKHGSAESRERYARTIAEWEQRGGIRDPRSTGTLTVAELCVAYWTHVDKTKPKVRAHTYRKCEHPFRMQLRNALGVLKRLYAETSLDDFGPNALRTVQQEMIKMKCKGRGREHLTWSRGYINDCIRLIEGMFKWGIAWEIAPPHKYHQLSAVAPLAKHKDIRERPRVTTVDDKHVDAVLAIATPTLAAMIRLQRRTGMRPGEVVQLRMVDIDTSGRTWLYRPQWHKTQHHEIERIIPLDRDCQEIIKTFVTLNPSEYLFKPINTWRERRALMEKASEGREKPVQALSLFRAEHRQSRIGRERYDEEKYYAAVWYLCDRARTLDINFKRWHPNQLRHSAATEIANTYGERVAQAVLGHTDVEMTRHYARRDVMHAVREMEKGATPAPALTIAAG